MNELPARIKDDPASRMTADLQSQLDALIRGDCSEQQFLNQVSILRESSPDSAWTILALIDQRYRLGHIPVDVFRSIESKIARRELEYRNYGTTISYQPGLTSYQPEVQAAIVPSAAFESLRHEPPPAPSALASAPIARPSSVTALRAVPVERSLPTLLPVPRATPTNGEIARVLRGRYIIEKLIGVGGMGAVFKALDQNRADLAEGNRHVAIKILHEKIGRRPEVVSDLRREFYCAQGLSHPNIVNVYDVDRDEDVVFFTMEYLDGELLSNVIERLRPFPLNRPHAWAIIRDVGAALAHAHSHGVVHGDLKPHNVMITNTGEVRLLDFGASSTLLRQRPMVTPAYTCCEILDGQHMDPRDDLYALACLSYELLAGDHPFQRRKSTEARDLKIRPVRPSGLTNRQWRTLQHGLAWSRDERSVSVRDWLELFSLKSEPERLPRPADLIAGVPRKWDLSAVPRAGRVAVVSAGLGVILASLGLLLAVHRAFTGGPESVVPRGITVAGAPPAKLFITPPVARVAAPVTPPVFQENQAPVALQLGLAPGSFVPALRDYHPLSALGAAPPVEFHVDPQAVMAAGTMPHVKTVPVIALLQKTPSASRSVVPNSRSTSDHGDNVSIASSRYHVSRGHRFVEIHVLRTNSSDDAGSFVWWTEPLTAKPGDDYVTQDRTPQHFAKGKRTARLFVRIVDNAARKIPAEFWVVIGELGGSASLGANSRTRVRISPSAE